MMTDQVYDALVAWQELQSGRSIAEYHSLLALHAVAVGMPGKPRTFNIYSWNCLPRRRKMNSTNCAQQTAILSLHMCTALSLTPDSFGCVGRLSKPSTSDRHQETGAASSSFASLLSRSLGSRINCKLVLVLLPQIVC